MKTFFNFFIKNKNLDKNDLNEAQIKQDIKELNEFEQIPNDSEIILNSIKNDSRKQLKYFFDEFNRVIYNYCIDIILYC